MGRRLYGEIKSFTDKQNVRVFGTTKPVLQQMLQELLQIGSTKDRKDLQKTNPKQSSKW